MKTSGRASISFLPSNCKPAPPTKRQTDCDGNASVSPRYDYILNAILTSTWTKATKVSVEWTYNSRLALQFDLPHAETILAAFGTNLNSVTFWASSSSKNTITECIRHALFFVRILYYSCRGNLMEEGQRTKWGIENLCTQYEQQKPLAKIRAAIHFAMQATSLSTTQRHKDTIDWLSLRIR